jgi:ABC-type phosphate/phosphonate transport system substrate-binding protein
MSIDTHTVLADALAAYAKAVRAYDAAKADYASLPPDAYEMEEADAACNREVALRAQAACADAALAAYAAYVAVKEST